MKKYSTPLFVLLAGLLFFSCGGGNSARENADGSAKIVHWKLATSWSATMHPLTDAAEEMAALVKTMSAGKFIIQIDSSNKHKSPLGVFEMVKLGNYEMAHSASYYWKGKDTAMLPFSTMPFGLTTPEQYAWFYNGGGLELMQKVYNAHGMYSFPGGNTGSQTGGWFRREIRTPADLRGLKMRIPGFAGEVLARLGVSVVNIAPGELYTALERGTIDALELAGPGMDINAGFHKIAPYCYTGWHEPATELQFLVNKQKYDRLPKQFQEILKIAMKLAAYNMYTLNYHMNLEAWEKITREFKSVKVKTFPKPVMDAIKKSYQELLKKMTNDNPMLKEILQSQEVYLKKARAWTRISDFIFLRDN